MGRGGSGKMPNFFNFISKLCAFLLPIIPRKTCEFYALNLNKLPSSEAQKRRISGVFTVDILSLFALAYVSHQKLKTGGVS